MVCSGHTVLYVGMFLELCR